MKAALERPSNAPKPSASRGEAGGKAGDKPSKPGRLLFDCEDLPFVPDSGVLILGKPIKEKPVPLKEVTAETGLTTVWGDIVRKESVTSKDGKWEIYSIDITDYTSSNTLKIIQSSSKKEAIEELKEGDTLVVRGDASYDKYEHDVTIRPLAVMLVQKLLKTDDAPVKRVELHLHSNMSTMDGMNGSADLAKLAHRWGHRRHGHHRPRRGAGLPGRDVRKRGLEGLPHDLWPGGLLCQRHGRRGQGRGKPEL